MKPRRGKWVALASAGLGLAVLAAAAVASRSWIAETWWIYRLEATDPTVQMDAAKKLGAMNSRRAIPGLVRFYESGHPADFEGLCAIFIDLGPEAVSALLKAKPDAKFISRDISKLVDALMACLDDPDPKVRSSALRHVGNLDLEGTNGFVGRMKSTLEKETNLPARLEMARILLHYETAAMAVHATIQDAFNSDDEDLCKEACRMIFQGNLAFHYSFRRALPALFKLSFQEHDFEARELARSRLNRIARVFSDERIGLPELREAMPALVRGLEQEEDRDWAIEFLAAIGPAAAAATPKLIDLLKEESQVMNESILALKSIGPGARAAVPALIDLVRNRFPSLDEVVLDAIGEIGEAPESVPFLIGILKDEEADLFDRELAAQALARVGGADARAAEALLAVVEGDSITFFRDCAALALGSMGSVKAVPRLRDLLSSEVSYPQLALVAMALGKIGPAAAEAVPQLDLLLTSESMTLRYWAVLALLRITRNAERYFPILMKLNKEWDDNWLPVLAELGPAAAEAVPEVVPRLAERPASRAAATALARIGPASVPHLVKSLEGKGWCLRTRAARVLRDIGPEAKAAIPALEALTRDEEQDEEVIRAAAEALAKIRG